MSTVIADRVQKRRRFRRPLGWVAVALVPLAVVGLTLAALGDPAEGVERVPVALVNDDEMITQVDEETGEETMVLAGRLLVTELTSDESAAEFDWRLTNAEDAADQLAAGEVYASLTIPADFSDAIISIQSDAPRQAQIDIRTDEAHSYVAGPVVDALGSGLVRAFGSEITETVVTTILTQVGDAFTEAADGASQLADGADELADGGTEFADGVAQYTAGASQLASGAGQLADGASSLSGGIGQYAAGVSDYAAGANQFSAGLNDPERGLPPLVAGTQQYVEGVSELSAALTAAVDALTANPTDPVALGTVAYLTGELETAAAGGGDIAQGWGAAVYGVHTAEIEIPGVLEGADRLADAADQLAGGANELRSGAQQLAQGVSGVSAGAAELASGGAPLSDGAAQLADGVGSLASGARDFADGMSSGAEAFADESQNSAMAEVVADPVAYSLDTEHQTSGSGTAIASVLAPYAAWLGALVIFLLIPPFRVRSLASSAGTGRLLLGALGRAGLLAAAQGVLLTLLVHTAGGVSWSLLPQTLTFLVLLSVVVTAFHGALVAAFGRRGLIASVVLLALQLAASGAVLPVEALSPVFGWLTPYLPLNWASVGLQQILTGGSAALATGSAIALVLFGAMSLVVALIALRRTRRAAVLSLLAPA